MREPAEHDLPGADPRVLVTGVGGPAGIAVMKSLVARAELFAGDMNPYAAGLYLVRPERRVVLAPGDDVEFAGHVLRLCRRKRIEAVVPTVDSELLPLAARRDEFEAHGIKLVLPPTETLELCAEPSSLLARCSGLVRVAPISGPVHGVEYSIDVLASTTGTVVAVVPSAPLKGGSVGRHTVHDARLELLGRQLAEAIGLTGFANLRVKVDPTGAPVLVAVTPRFTGTVSLAIAAGVDMPSLCLAETLGLLRLGAAREFADVAMVRHLEETFLSPDELVAMARRGALPEPYVLEAA